MPPRKANTVIVGFILQGRPYVLMDEETPFAWPSISAARNSVDSLIENRHAALKAADSIVITDLDSGQSEVFL